MAVPVLPEFNGGGLTDQQLNQIVAGIAYALSPPSVALLLTAPQLIPNTLITAVSFSSAESNLSGMWTSGTNVNINDPGTYVVTWGGAWTPNGTPRRSMLPLRNGAFLNQTALNISDAVNQTILSGADTVYCNQGDVLTLNAFQTSGGALNLLLARFGVSRVSA